MSAFPSCPSPVRRAAAFVNPVRAGRFASPDGLWYVPDVETGGTEAMEAGRQGTLRALVDAYARPLTRFFSRRTSAAVDVPDLVQDVFLRLSRMPDPEAIRRPESLVFVTASNVLKDRARRARVRSEGLADPIDEIASPGSDFAPDRVLEGKQAVARLHEALMDLPERTRDVFVMRMLEGMRMADVAAAMNISTRAAEKHQARALAHVAERLREWR